MSDGISPNWCHVLRGLSLRLPLSTLAQTLFPFFRHTIPNVRLAVVKTLHSFMDVSSLPKDWVATPLLRLLFQNLISEEREDIRNASLSAWRRALSILPRSAEVMESSISQQLLLDWYAAMMTPIGVAINSSTFYHSSTANDGDVLHERHNVDKNMLAQDLSLVSTEVTLKARVAAATALATLMMFWPSEVCFSFTMQQNHEHSCALNTAPGPMFSAHT